MSIALEVDLIPVLYHQVKFVSGKKNGRRKTKCVIFGIKNTTQTYHGFIIYYIDNIKYVLCDWSD